MTGRIKKILRDKGFGFIRGANERDVFFHADDVVGARAFADLRPGDAVQFQPVASERGPRAGNVEAV